MGMHEYLWGKRKAMKTKELERIRSGYKVCTVQYVV